MQHTTHAGLVILQVLPMVLSIYPGAMYRSAVLSNVSVHSSIVQPVAYPNYEHDEGSILDFVISGDFLTDEDVVIKLCGGWLRGLSCNLTSMALTSPKLSVW